MKIFGYNMLNVTPLKSVSMNNQKCKISLKKNKNKKQTDINSNELKFYLYSIEVNKCSSSCNNINDPYSK